MLRRLLLTGGLIVLGERSNSQILLGALVCTCWLCVLLARRPYEAQWDNALSSMLAFQLLVVREGGCVSFFFGFFSSPRSTLTFLTPPFSFADMVFFCFCLPRYLFLFRYFLLGCRHEFFFLSLDHSHGHGYGDSPPDSSVCPGSCGE